MIDTDRKPGDRAEKDIYTPENNIDKTELNFDCVGMNYDFNGR